MKAYVGCKIIKAVPCTLGDYRLQKYGTNQVVFKEGMDISTSGYLVEYPDNYISWSPKEVFEKAYREIQENEFELLRKE